ncbi:MAG: NADH:flavin oxidoreductase [Planctomycetota bacterium]|jgi:2,4-dienoyl-CoA reductase-like NADH-dependent reductase (Old Yellow Enzyme family)
MKSLFQETRIKSLSLSNRFVRSATWMAMADLDGACTDRLYDCYETLGKGDIGLIISGFAFVSREGQGPEGQLGIYKDGLVDGLRKLTGRVHAGRGRIAAQIVHCGGASKKENNGGLEVIGPSDRFDEEGNRIARAMTKEEIHRIVDDFGAGAERAKESGFDAIQLHYAHGYLGSQFLCPKHNRREDEYGGSIENRFRLLKEVYAKVRDAVGDDYPVMAKLNIEDFFEDGLARDDGLKAAVMLRDLGLDALEVSGGAAESGKLGPARRIKTEEEEAYFKDNATAVKMAVDDMPVMLVGGLRTPLVMLHIHRAVGIEYFSMSRPFIREPHLIQRWKSGKTAPAECVSCSGCFLSIKQGRGVFCVKTRKKKKEKGEEEGR